MGICDMWGTWGHVAFDSAFAERYIKKPIFGVELASCRRCNRQEVNVK